MGEVIKVWMYDGKLAPVQGAAQIEFYMRGKQKNIPISRGCTRDEAIAALEEAGEIWEEEWTLPDR